MLIVVVFPRPYIKTGIRIKNSEEKMWRRGRVQEAMSVSSCYGLFGHCKTRARENCGKMNFAGITIRAGEWKIARQGLGGGGTKECQ